MINVFLIVATGNRLVLVILLLVVSTTTTTTGRYYYRRYQYTATTAGTSIEDINTLLLVLVKKKILVLYYYWYQHKRRYQYTTTTTGTSKEEDITIPLLLVLVQNLNKYSKQIYFCQLFILSIKGYVRYKTITSQNVPSKVQIKNFFISWKNYVPLSRFSSFCIFNHSMIYQISDVTISISK